jgi:hypothetical protein
MIALSRKAMLCLMLVAGLTASTRASFAGWFDKHPGYMHAISDLRDARALLDHPDPKNVEWDQSKAVGEIDACINDLKQAALNDGKNLADRPAPDVGLDFHGRLHKTLDLLRKARSDMDKEEDDRANSGLQKRANEHVDRAIDFVKKAIGDKKADSL